MAFLVKRVRDSKDGSDDRLYKVTSHADQLVSFDSMFDGRGVWRCMV